MDDFQQFAEVMPHEMKEDFTMDEMVDDIFEVEHVGIRVVCRNAHTAWRRRSSRAHNTK